MFALLQWAAGTAVAEEVADLVLLHGLLSTMDPSQASASALAVAGDRLVAIGSDAEIAALIGPATTVIDARARRVVPGFIEGHGHFMALGESLSILDLRAAADWQEIVAAVAAAVADAPPGAWILGHGWHQEKWRSLPEDTVGGVPGNRSLNLVSARNPVMLEHASGHGAIVNAAALALAGIDAATPDPAGGRIVRDASGAATGWLVDSAADAVRKVYDREQQARAPRQQRAAQVALVQRAGNEALAKGVTTFHDAGAPFATIDLYRELATAGELPLRMYVMVGGESNEVLGRQLAHYRVIGAGDNFLTVRAIKRMVDGALGSRSAWLLEPYTDQPDSTGLVVDTLATIGASAELAIANGYQLNTHAIGDRANREILDLYERVQAAHPDARDLRWRIEHAQHLHPRDVSRFAALGVIASMQGVHATSDGPWVAKRLGNARAGERTYVWRSLWDAGAVVTNGTDVPVEDIDPIQSFYASVSRRLADGSTFFPEQRLSREEALRSYTLNNAYAAFEESLKGSLSAGKLADFVVLSRDIMTIPEAEIPAARVDCTVLGGRIAYRREDACGAP
jgi:predicted amidohydrolase YtcJ